MSFSMESMSKIAAAIVLSPVAGAGISYVGQKILPAFPSSPNNVVTAEYVAFYTASNVILLDFLAKKVNNDPLILSAVPVMLLSTQSSFITALQQLYASVDINYQG